MVVITCEICNKKFNAKRSTRKICDRKRCNRERNRIYVERFYKNNPKKREIHVDFMRNYQKEKKKLERERHPAIQQRYLCVK